jgi:D-arabinose 1-dehydrogenase-like Zn-dependent alcohol dehydrogenase
MTGTMKAARLHGFESTHGARELLRVEEVSIPDIAEGEVLVRVLRAGLNHGDLHMREDAVQYTPEVKTVPDLPMTIGHDGLGEVVEVAPDVVNVRVGDRVVVICSITCGFCKFCRTERQHLCTSKKTMGFLTKWGGGPSRLRRYKDGLWAEYCRVPATQVIRVPGGADIDEVCKVSQINVGYRSLKRARLQPGETVIVNGASGITGIGTVLSALAMGAARIGSERSIPDGSPPSLSDEGSRSRAQSESSRTAKGRACWRSWSPRASRARSNASETSSPAAASRSSRPIRILSTFLYATS